MKSIEYNSIIHNKLFAEFFSVHKIQHVTICSKRYPALQAFNCKSEQNFKRGGLRRLADTGKIRTKVLPNLDAEDKRRVKSKIECENMMTHGYTYVEDGWASRAKKHMTASFICLPETPA